LSNREALPRFLIVDGYTREARDQLQAGGASVAADLYQKMLSDCAPFQIECDILFPCDDPAALPMGEELAGYCAIAWTGCSLSLAEESPEVARQVAFARLAFERGIPSFGSCWAAQIAVVAAGGTVEVNPRGREMGIARKIELTAAGKAHPMYRGKPAVFDAFISHDDHITRLPEGAVSLAGNDWTAIQSVSVRHLDGEFWGLQYHPEYDLHELARLAFCRTEKLIGLGFFADEKAAERYITDLETLHNEPERRDIAWRLGVDADVMDPAIRTIEVGNWIEQQVAPRLAASRFPPAEGR